MMTSSAPRVRDAYCSYCGARFDQVAAYPRSCAACGAQVWANPIPVAVALVPIVEGVRTGLLVVRRAIPPVGKLALVGGFVEDHERWQVCAARELREEANVVVDPDRIEPMWFTSSEPVPNRVLLFGVAPPIDARALPPFAANAEASERGAIFGAQELAFPLHVEAVRRYFRGGGSAAYQRV
jgi:ADP-ribose pyrophosphatase YjhB (NUDIX family)